MSQTNIEATAPPLEHQRWNFAVNLVERTFVTLGFSMISVTTILPLLVMELTSSKIAIGIVPAIFMVGTMVPQLLTANYTESLPYKRPFVSRYALLGGRLPHLLIGAVVWWFALDHPTFALLLIYLLLATASCSNGIVIPAWLDLIAKVIPVRMRGLFFGIGNGLGALLGVAGGVLAGHILSTLDFPGNFALCFTLAFVAMTISWIGVSLTREPRSDNPKQSTTLSDYLRNIPSVLKRNPNYARYLVSQVLMTLSGLGTGFLIVYANETYGLTGTQVGTLTAILVGSQAVMNLAWGLIGDRLGHKTVLACGAFCMATAITLTWVSRVVPGLWAAFVFLGAATAANAVSGMSIVLEFGLPQERPTYVGLTNTALAPTTMLAPIVGGALIEGIGYIPTFAAAALSAGIGGMLLALWFRDPRKLVRVG